jgi:hypothetical protein
MVWLVSGKVLAVIIRSSKVGYLHCKVQEHQLWVLTFRSVETPMGPQVLRQQPRT